jgi:hypothetical protein
MKTQHELKTASAQIVMKFLEEGFTLSEGKSVLAFTLAMTSRSDGDSLHEAISQFTSSAKSVYDEAGEKE